MAKLFLGFSRKKNVADFALDEKKKYFAVLELFNILDWH